MPSNFPKDRFDDLPHKLDRVGAHRAPAKRGKGWVTFWWALAATIVLVAIGVLGLFYLNNRLDFALPGTNSPTPTASASATPTRPPTAEPTLDPSLSITVLNGTPGTGVASGVGQTLTEAGWSVGATSNADTETVPATIVYYADASLEGAARGVLDSIATTIPTATILLSSDFADTGADITVVVGNDYVPAG
ncbi:LytR C-terminal domain-containing protein [Glaciibacter sp. 2TAF33]|uniref:LytR C-terminal domain-containing protein n=1 Tax=Glaciibacter sp. 2TAF33 TaxID=3233015 RepID=UPI003F929F57